MRKAGPAHSNFPILQPFWDRFSQNTEEHATVWCFVHSRRPSTHAIESHNMLVFKRFSDTEALISQHLAQPDTWHLLSATLVGKAAQSHCASGEVL